MYAINEYAECSFISEFVHNKALALVLIIAGVVLTILLCACSLALCRYRRLKYQYYERVSLIRNRDGVESGSQTPSGENKQVKQQQQIFRISDNDDE